MQTPVLFPGQAIPVPRGWECQAAKRGRQMPAPEHTGRTGNGTGAFDFRRGLRFGFEPAPSARQLDAGGRGWSPADAGRMHERGGADRRQLTWTLPERTIMPTYMARSQWNGTLKEGTGSLRVGSDAFESAMSPQTRKGEVTNPEEVVGAALAGCYTLMLAKTLDDAGHSPETIQPAAAVDLQHEDGRVRIPRISLDVEVQAAELDENRLQELAREADDACPVSQALGGTTIDINARQASSKSKA